MEIEYKRELTKSYMCVKTDQDFLPFEKEILTRSSILGIVPVNTILRMLLQSAGTILQECRHLIMRWKWK